MWEALSPAERRRRTRERADAEPRLSVVTVPVEALLPASNGATGYEPVSEDEASAEPSPRCSECGEPFVPATRGALTCSKPCSRDRALRKKRARHEATVAGQRRAAPKAPAPRAPVVVSAEPVTLALSHTSNGTAGAEDLGTAPPSPNGERERLVGRDGASPEPLEAVACWLADLPAPVESLVLAGGWTITRARAG